MQVWILSRGCRYEGGYVVSVHLSADKGQAALQAELDSHAKEIESFRNEDSFWNDPRFDMAEIEPGYWSNSSDFIELREWEAT